MTIVILFSAVAVFGVVLFLVLNDTVGKIDKKINALSAFFNGTKNKVEPFISQYNNGLVFDYSGSRISLNITGQKVYTLELSLLRKNGLEFLFYAEGRDYEDSKALNMPLIDTQDPALKGHFKIYSKDDLVTGRLTDISPELVLLAGKGFTSLEADANSIKAMKSCPDIETDLEPENVKFVIEKLLKIGKNLKK